MKAKINYDNDQAFLCQGCGRKYRHGNAKGNMAFADDNAVGHPYHPGLFCCAGHEDDYLVKHKRYPAVGYEIPLGDWEPSAPGLIKACGPSPGDGFITVDAVPFVAHDPVNDSRNTKAAPPSPPVEG